MHDLDALHRLYTTRRSAAAKQHGRWRELAAIYDGDLVLPLPELDQTAASAVPGIITTTIDWYSRRFAGVQPAVSSPAVRPNIASSRQKASERAAVVRGWWEHSFMGLADLQRGRFFFGYGAMPAVVRPSPVAAGVPRWEALNPMSVLPGARTLPYSPEIEDAFIAVTRSASWLREQYGVSLESTEGDKFCEVVEFIDAEQVTCFALTPAYTSRASYSTASPYPLGFAYGGWEASSVAPRRVKGGGWMVPLYSTPNLAGRCTVSFPGAISLSRVGGLVDNVLGMHKMQAMMMALTTEAITRGIFPDQYVVFGDGGGQVVTAADGMRGILGQIENGTVQMQQIQPAYQTFQMMDLLERNQRITAGAVPQIGGENPSNVRTGRASDTVSGFAVDPILAEAQEIMQTAREHENRLAVAVCRGYGGERRQSMYVPRANGARERTDYVPEDLFAESDETVVRYSLMGADAQGLIIAAAQSIGTEMMSKDRARTLNPFVEDPEAEAVKIRTETLEAALMSVAAELVAASPADAASLLKKVAANMPLADALEAVQKEAQERQASSGPPGAPDGPVPPGSPEAQPGLAPEGAGAEAPVAVDAPPPSLGNLAQLFTQTRRPAMTVPAERVG